MGHTEFAEEHQEGANPCRIPVEVCERIIEHVTTSVNGEPWLSPHRQFADLTDPEQHGTVPRKWYSRTALPSLCACALTCRAWLPKSRACMYRNLLFGKTEKRAFQHLVRSLDENPSLRQLVLSFNIMDDGGPLQRPPDIVPGRIPDIMQTWACMLACKLPMLTSMGVSFTYLRSRERRVSVLRMLPTLRSFTTVTSLHLQWYGNRVVSEVDLFRLITAFRDLRKLTLQSDWSYRPPEGPVATPATGPWQKESALKAMPPIVWLRVFSAGGASGSVGDGTVPPIVDNLLRATAPTLERLAIDKSLVPYFKTSDQDDTAELPSPTYREMPRMQALHIHCWDTDTEGSPATQWFSTAPYRSGWSVLR
ncbi:hypothetical protein GY45DRAFT_584349 [Cubamyces sp. BRFM 1775]|nr:hypothetical protein GY45DRAFT_584349 [Cubamyces sp. BRFM 1775]